MADYDTEVGIKIDAELEAALSQLDKIISKMGVFEGQFKGLSSSLNSINNLAKGLRSIAGINLGTLESQLKGVKTQLNSFSKGIDVSNIKSAVNSVNSLKTATRGIGKVSLNFDTSNAKSGHLENTVTSLKKFVESFNGMKLNGLSGIKELPKAMERIQKLDLTKLRQSFSMMNKQVIEFITNLNKGKGSLQAFSNITKNLSSSRDPMSALKSSVKNVGNEADKSHKSISKMFSVGRIYWFANYTRQAFRGIGKMITSAIDFRETENLFSVAMKNMRGEAMKFQETITNSFGLALPDMMKAQGIFKNMLGSITGLEQDMQTKLSETMTKMAVDFSSLYNTSIESAITKMQSALSRQVRPIRSVSGMDITQNVLGGSLQQMGIYDRSVMQLGEMEKRLVVIYTLMEQMRNSGAMGDFARTIENPAQQLKILQQQVSEVGRWIGAVFEGTLGRILPYINGFVMAIKEVIKTFALFVGYEIPDSTGVVGSILDQMGDESDNLQDSIGGVNSGLDGTEKKLKQIKNLLSSKDELNIIQEPEDTSSGGSGGGSGGAGGLGSIDPRILNALKEYENMMESVRMKAMDIRDAILGWMDATGKAINENIFAPIKISWDKYGTGIMFNFGSGFNNLKILAGDFFNIWKSNWKLNFQSVSDLFFSLLETGSIVFNAITEFMLDVWNKGGKYLYESLNKLFRSFVNLATNINDEFVKPIIRWFKDNLLDAISSTFGFGLKIIGGFVNILSDFVNFLAQKGNPTLKIFIGIWATWKIAKTASDFMNLAKKVNAITGPLSKSSSLSMALAGNLGSLGQKTGSLVTFFSKLLTQGLNPALIGFPKLNGIFNTNNGNIAKFGQSMGESVIKMSNLTGSTGPLGGALTKVGGWLSSASFTPWAVGIGAAAGAILSLVGYLSGLETESEKVDKRLADFNEKRQSELDSLRETTKQNIETGFEETIMFERNVERLKELVDENGKLKGSKEEVKSVIEQINEVMPESISWIDEETISIKDGIGSLSNYVDKKKAQIIVDAELESSAKAIIKIRKLEAEQDTITSKIKQLNSQNESDTILTKEMLATNASEEEQIRYNNALARMGNYQNALDELEGKQRTNSDTISGYKKDMAKADTDAMALMSENTSGYSLVVADMSSFVISSYQDINEYTSLERSDMLLKEQEYLASLSDANFRASKGITDEQYTYLQQQYQNHVTWNDQIKAEEAEKNTTLIDLLNIFGYKLDNKTLAVLTEVYNNYKDYGYSSGKDFLKELEKEMKNNDGVISQSTLTALGIKGEIEKQSYIANVKTTIDKSSLDYTVGSLKGAMQNVRFKINGSGSSGMYVEAYANGGFPNVGQLFIANERGPELVGTMGGKPAVANQTQIDVGIENASYRGMSRALRENSSSSKSQPIIANINIGRRTITEVIDEEEEENFMKTGKRK